jgi:dihydrolipoamide dehydrogenase
LVGKVSIDVKKMLARKDGVVKQNNDGILYLFKKNKVTFFHGRGCLWPVPADGGYQKSRWPALPKTVMVRQARGGGHRLQRPCAARHAVRRSQRVLSNDGALRVGEVPKKLGVIGSGVIGLEMGSVWRRLGAEVTVLGGLPAFLPAVDEPIAKEAHKAFTKQGLKIELGVTIGEVKNGKKGMSAWPTPTPRARRRTLGGGQAHRQHRPRAPHHRAERRRGGSAAR